MRNILSCIPGTRFRGKEIKEWIKFHTENQTEYTREAKRMINYLNVSDDAEYYICKGDYQANGRKFCVIRADRVKDEIVMTDRCTGKEIKCNIYDLVHFIETVFPDKEEQKELLRAMFDRSE